MRAKPATPQEPRDGPAVGIHDTEPARRWEDAFLSGNGEYGIMVLGDPVHERIVHNHHRFVLPNESRTMQPPALASRLEAVRDLLLAGRQVEAQRAFSDGRALAWTQPFHPGHVLHIDTVSPEGTPGGVHDYRRRTRFTTGEVITSWFDGERCQERRAFVSRPDRVVVVEIAGPRLDLNFRLSADTPGRPSGVTVTTHAEAGGAGEAEAGEAGANAAGLRVVATYPPLSGDAATGTGPAGFFGVTRLLATGGTVFVTGDQVQVRAAQRVLLLTRSDRWTTRAPLGEVLSGLNALPADYELLLARHVAVHGELFDRCGLDLGASSLVADLPVADLIARGQREVLDPALVQAMFASGRYLLLSSCGVLPPRLTGLWLGAWGAAWSGDYTTDANLNLQLAAVTLTGMPELVAGYVGLLAAQVDDWRLNARAVYGVGGFLAPSRTDGEHGRLIHFDDDWPWPMWLAGADWLLLPLLEYWQATGDDAFLEAVLAPWLVAVATFFEEILTRYDTAGHLVLVPSLSPEVGPRGCAGLAGVNATMDLAAARHALTVAADVVERLGTDPAAADRWRAVAERLPPYRVDARGALAEWAWPGLETADDHRHVSHLYPVWPLHDITPDDTPELAAAALAALTARGDENLSGHGSLHRALVAARLRHPDLVRENLRKILARNMVFRSLMTSHNPDLEVYNADAAHGLPAVVVELLLDSRPGTIELIPALPPEWVTGRLSGVRTRAGVRVDELTWDQRRGEVRVVLAAPVERTLAVVCRAARQAGDVRRQVRVLPGSPMPVVVATPALG
jgi:alpha-L-fucosidase 2